MTTVAQVSEQMQALFTSVVDALAERSGFVQRRSKLCGAAFAQALLVGWPANPQPSPAELAQAAGIISHQVQLR